MGERRPQKRPKLRQLHGLLGPACKLARNMGQDAQWMSFWSPVFGRFQLPGELFVLLGEAHLPKPAVDLAQGCV